MKPVDEYHAKVVAEATSFVASTFRGRGAYETWPSDTVEGARQHIREMARRNLGRILGIYAVSSGSQVLMEPYNPEDYMTKFEAHIIQKVDDKWKVNSFISVASAEKEFEAIPALEGVMVKDEKDLKEAYSGTDLVAIYNQFAARPIKKFETLDVAVARVWTLLNNVGPAAEAPVAEAAADPETPLTLEEELDKSTKKAKEKKAPVGRKSKFGDDEKITVLAEANPKRAGTKAHDRFALYRTGMLVKTFMEKGGTGADLAYDTEHKHIKID